MGSFGLVNRRKFGTPFFRQIGSKVGDYYVLTKPEVNLLILITTSAGYYLGTPSGLHLSGLFRTLLGTLLVASGTATLNQWMESVWDARMRRTADRPIPSGRVSEREAFVLGMLLSIAGGIYLAAFVNWFSAVLGVSTLLSYLLIYTPLKRHTPLCTLLGAVPGAMPTLIGWAGAAGTLNWQAFYLFAVLFLWQFPHFLAIALMYREDYERAGYRMLPRFDRESKFTRSEIVAFTVMLIVATVLPALQRGLPYSALLLLAGTFLLYHTIRLVGSGTRVLAARVLHASVLYLPVALAIMAAAKR